MRSTIEWTERSQEVGQRRIEHGGHRPESRKMASIPTSRSIPARELQRGRIGGLGGALSATGSAREVEIEPSPSTPDAVLRGRPSELL